MAAVIIKPAADNTTSDVEAVERASWGELAENVSADDPGADYTYSYEDVEDDAPPPTTIARVWTPDCIIKQVTGPFAAYSKFKGLEQRGWPTCRGCRKSCGCTRSAS